MRSAVPPWAHRLGGHFHYDQVAVFPGATQDRVEAIGVFDFDTALFRELWENSRETTFRAYLRYYVSDHPSRHAEPRSKTHAAERVRRSAAASWARRARAMQRQRAQG